MKKLLTAAAASLWTACTLAAPVSLGSVEHLYGTDSGRQLSSIMGIYHPGGNCDSANTTSLTVKATSAANCNRFADAFDFSGLSYDSIDHFELTLDFSGARNQGFLGSERWNVRASSSYAQSATTFGSALNASGPQTFTFSSSQALFNNIVNGEAFFLMFSTNSGSSMNFNLNSARLEVFGAHTVAAVPEPASLALVGLSLLALVGVRRSRKQPQGTA